MNGCSVKNAMSARPVNLPISKLPVVCQSEPSPRSGKQPFKRHKHIKQVYGVWCMVYGVREICIFLAARAKICSNFGRRLAYGNSPEVTFARLCEFQALAYKNSNKFDF